MAIGRLALRAAVGGLMLGHGLQKLNGSFGGPGLEGAEGMMGAIGMHPAREQARAAALSETIGGALTAAGFLSPLGPAMIIGTMTVAAAKVHLPKGLWSHEGGYEYNLVLATAAMALADIGSGPLSIDAVLGKRRDGTAWALAAAGLGAGAAWAALAVSDRMAPAVDPSATAAVAQVQSPTTDDAGDPGDAGDVTTETPVAGS